MCRQLTCSLEHASKFACAHALSLYILYLLHNLPSWPAAVQVSLILNQTTTHSFYTRHATAGRDSTFEMLLYWPFGKTQPYWPFGKTQPSVHDSNPPSPSRPGKCGDDACMVLIGQNTCSCMCSGWLYITFRHTFLACIQGDVHGS